jgi:hypothetical protein
MHGREGSKLPAPSTWEAKGQRSEEERHHESIDAEAMMVIGALMILSKA